MSDRKYVLFMPLGFTQAVVTETMYGLLKRKDKAPVMGGEIHIMTTTICRGQALGLLEDKRIESFNEDYKTDWKLQKHWISVPSINDVTEISDIRDEQTISIFADEIMNFIRKFTAKPDVILHASVAGGRKTMGIYVQQAMSWFARAEDEISHVLVDKDSERPDFYYPKPGEEDKHEVSLSLLPFVRMQGALPDFINRDHRINDNKGLTYQEMVESSALYINDVLNKQGNIVLVRESRTLIFEKKFVIDLSPQGMALFEYLFNCANVHEDIKPKQGVMRLSYGLDYVEMLGHYLDEYNTHIKDFKNKDQDVLPDEWNIEIDDKDGKLAEKRKAQLTSAVTKLKKDLSVFPWIEKASFRVQHGSHGTNSRFVDIDPARVTFRDY